MENSENYNPIETIDLADGSFISDWPQWIRWVLFLPAALIGAMLINGFYALIMYFSPYEVTSQSIKPITTIIFASSFIYCGVWMTPRHQFTVSIILLTLLVIISTFNVMMLQDKSTLINSLITILSGIITVVYLKSKFK